MLLVLLKERVSLLKERVTNTPIGSHWHTQPSADDVGERVCSSQRNHHGISTESRGHAQSCKTRRLSGRVAIDFEVDSVPRSPQGASRDASIDRLIDHAEQDAAVELT